MESEQDIRAILAKNLRLLMHRRTPKWTQKELEKEAGVAQRTISNMLRAATDETISGATLERIDRVARVFGLQGWHLVCPYLADTLDDIGSMTDVMTGYRLADKDGRAVIHSVAEREAKYRSNQPPAA